MMIVIKSKIFIMTHSYGINYVTWTQKNQLFLSHYVQDFNLA